MIQKSIREPRRFYLIALIGSVIVAANLLASLSARAAPYASYTSWVAAVCDEASGRAMVRFGYTDSDGEPFDVHVPGIGGELSKLPVDNGPLDAGACSLPNGREVRIRVGYGPTHAYGGANGLPKHRFSVWVDKIGIIHAEDADAEHLPYAVIIEKRHFRRCHLLLSKDESRKISGKRRGGTPVECEKHATAIAGAVDLDEYPAASSPPYPFGSIRIERSSDDHLCRSMIATKAEFPDPQVYEGDVVRHVGFDAWLDGSGEEMQMVTPRKVGGVVKLDWTEATDDVPQRWAIYDIRNSGRPERVFAFSDSSTAVHGNYFGVVPQDVPMDEIGKKLWTGFDFDLLSGEGTPYRDVNTNLWMIRSSETSYLLAVSTNGDDPTAILLKPKADRSMEEICVFQGVGIHF